MKYDSIGQKLLELDVSAGDIPYDNSTSDLTATDVQSAIDELASEEQTLFFGSVNSDGTEIVLPDGWSSSSIGAGQLRVTHNLGLSSGDDLVVVITQVNQIDGGHFFWYTSSTNSFDVFIRDVDNAAESEDFSFMAKKVV